MSTIIHVMRTNNNGGAGIVLNFINSQLKSKYDNVIEYKINNGIEDEIDAMDAVRDLKLMINDDESIELYINSDLSDHLADTYTLFSAFPNNKCYFRMHDMFITNQDWINMDSAILNRYDLKTALRILKMVSLNDKNTLVVSSKEDCRVLSLLGIRHEFSPFDGIVTKNTNTGKYPIKVIDKPNNHVLYVAAYYAKAKGIINLLHAIDNSKYNEFTWHIAGIVDEGGEYEHDFQQYGELFMRVIKRPDVKYHGYVSGDEMAKLYQLCDRVLILSTVESYSVTAYEGLSYGDIIVNYDFYDLDWQYDNNSKVINLGNRFSDVSYEYLGKLLLDSLRSSEYRSPKLLKDRDRNIDYAIMTMLLQMYTLKGDIIPGNELIPGSI